MGPVAECFDSAEVKSQPLSAQKVSGGNQETHEEAWAKEPSEKLSDHGQKYPSITLV